MDRYNLLFQGKIIDGVSLEEVKDNFSRLFKTDIAATAFLFSGKAVVIKKNLDVETTKKYLAVLKNAGAIIEAVKIENLKAADEDRPDDNNSTVQEPVQEPKQNITPRTTLSSGLSSLINYNKIAQNSTNNPPETISNTTSTVTSEKQNSTHEEFTLAAPNTDIPNQKKAPPVEIPDISYLQMSEAQSGSLEEFAAIIEAIELPDIDHLTLSEANTGSLEEFTIRVEPVELPDISSLEISEQNDAFLSDQSPKQKAVELPDISELSLSNAEQGSLENRESKPIAAFTADTSHLELELPKEKPVISGRATYQIDET